MLEVSCDIIVGKELSLMPAPAAPLISLTEAGILFEIREKESQRNSRNWTFSNFFLLRDWIHTSSWFISWVNHLWHSLITDARQNELDKRSAFRLFDSTKAVEAWLAMTGPRCWASCSDHVECWVGIFIMTRSVWSSLSLWRESPMRAMRMGRMVEMSSRMSKSLKRRLGRLFSCEHHVMFYLQVIFLSFFPSFLPAIFIILRCSGKDACFVSGNPNLSRKLLDGLPGCPALSQSYQD